MEQKNIQNDSLASLIQELTQEKSLIPETRKSQLNELAVWLSGEMKEGRIPYWFLSVPTIPAAVN